MPRITYEKIEDPLSRFGAQRLCVYIIEYWAARGCRVSAWRYQIEGTESWGVRSNLVGGLPR